MESVAIYLSGSIQKGHEVGSNIGWSYEDKETIRQTLEPMEVQFLDPSRRQDDLSDQESVFGRDLTQVFVSDCVLVDARSKRGLGVGAEMMWAKLHSIPVISFCPHETHYRRSGASILGEMVTQWVHPFVYSLSDYVANSLEDACGWIAAYYRGEITEIKDYKALRQTMEHYKTKHFDEDAPMYDLVQASAVLQEKMELVTST